jgi:hypothetical protein
VRSLDIIDYFFAELGKKLRDDVVARQSLSILGFKKLLANDAFRINKEIAGSGHAFELSNRFGVQDVVIANDFRIGIGEHRKIDLLPVREKLQDGFGIIADRRQLDALFFESRLSALQLDQLPFAVGSPIGRAEEKKNGSFRTFQRLKRVFTAKLVARRKRGRLLAYFKPDRCQLLNGCNPNGITLKRALDRDAISEKTGRLILCVEFVDLSDRVIV